MKLLKEPVLSEQIVSDEERQIDQGIRQSAVRALHSGNFDFALKALEEGEVNITDLLEDIKIYQAELEVQNEELRQNHLIAENAMRRFGNLFNWLPLPALVVDDLGVVLECNEMASQRFKLSRHHLRSHFFLRLIKKQDQGRVQRVMAETKDRGKAVICNVCLHSSDTSELIADIHTTLLPEIRQLSPQYLVTIVDQTQSIAQRKALEASRRHFMAYFDGAPLGMAAINPDQGWLEVNQQFCILSGYERGELMRMTWLELTYPDDIEHDVARFNGLLSGETDGYELEKRLIRKDGNIVDVRVAARGLRRPDGHLDYLVIIVEDISSRKLAERMVIERDQALKTQALQLRERVKELRTIYAISRAAQQMTDNDTFLAEVLQLIPPGMLYPEDTGVSITLCGKTTATGNASQLLARLSSPIIVDGELLGEIVIGYAKPHDDIDKGPFFNEEQALIEGIAEQIGRLYSHLQNEQQRMLTDQRNAALLSLTTMAPTMTEPELLKFALEQAEALTGSIIAYAHFIHDDQEHIIFGAWSTNTVTACQAIEDSHYPISRVGIWADSFRLKKPIIHDDYAALGQTCGLPDGHVQLSRHMSVPVMEGNKVMMIIGVGNKAKPYNEGDLTMLEIIANNTWALLQRNRSQRRLELHAEVFGSSQEAVVITDAACKILSVNEAFSRITGYALEEAVGQTPRLLKSNKHDSDFYQTMWRQITAKGHWQGEIWNRRKNGEVYPQWLGITAVKSDKGEVSEYIGICMDISDYKAAQARIEYLAHHDSLTDLCNRTLLRDRFKYAKAYAHRQDTMVGVVFLDLDHFKNINDSLGHPMGDKLLLQVASRLLDCVREIDTVSRLGGDEFVILLNDIRSYDNIADISQKILNVLSQPFSIDDNTLNVTCSIGACLWPNDGEDFDTLLKKADTVLYQAKSLGRNNYQFFTEDMNEKVVRRMKLESEMRQGLGMNQFFLHYQPQFDITSDRMIGVEALVRWQHPALGTVSPGEFIPVAEESGFIVDLGHYILRQACLQMVQWLEEGYQFRVAVNVSYAQFMRNNLLQMVLDTLLETGLPPQCLELELTESILAAQPEKILLVIRKLKELGVHFSIDDFGTGYSSLSYLKRFAVDKLKIDQSFIHDVPGDPEDEAIVYAIINLAHSLKIECIAEGVETQKQADYLRSMCCKQIQGYLFSKPLSVIQISEFLKGDLHRE
ncbi:MAG: bifunctional diguanylate cyclase/phosphodiesterase [Methylobacter sp.]